MQWESAQIASLHPGQSITIIRELTPGDTKAATKLMNAIACAATRYGKAPSYRYESFTALTAQQRPIVGCIVTAQATKEQEAA